MPELRKFSSKSFKEVRSVQFVCLIGSAASSFNSVRGPGAGQLLSGAKWPEHLLLVSEVAAVLEVTGRRGSVWGRCCQRHSEEAAVRDIVSRASAITVIVYGAAAVRNGMSEVTAAC